MLKIDLFNHYFPKTFFERYIDTGGIRDIGKRLRNIRAIHDLEFRFEVMDSVRAEYGDYVQVLTLPAPAIEAIIRRHTQSPIFYAATKLISVLRVPRLDVALPPDDWPRTRFPPAGGNTPCAGRARRVREVGRLRRTIGETDCRNRSP